MADPIRVGVVGLGYFGSFHARHYAVHPDVVFTGVADPGEARAEFVRATYGEIHVADPAELIGKVDAVSIAAPTALHHSVAGAFIDAGVHVLVEKPLAATAAEAIDLTKRAARAGVVLQVGHIERFNPAYRALKSALGEPRLLELRRHAPWTGRVTDVDVVLDLMIHDIDLALDLAGSEVTGVEAAAVEMMGYGFDVVNARLSFAGGAVAELSASRVAAAPARSIVVYERSRTFAADLTGRTVSAFAATGTEQSAVEVVAADALGTEIQAFLDAIRGEDSVGVPGGAAAAALSVAEAIRDAAAGRR
ncbi:MAG: Gfo/Idh/MocA family oxidoreductase [Bauldia sp.]|nr:Gfo/Idh/MocA family oxidoreductase [Bauldia sp.]